MLKTPGAASLPLPMPAPNGTAGSFLNVRKMSEAEVERQKECLSACKKLLQGICLSSFREKAEDSTDMS